MARRAQHLRCSQCYVREANERKTGWITRAATRGARAACVSTWLGEMSARSLFSHSEESIEAIAGVATHSMFIHCLPSVGQQLRCCAARFAAVGQTASGIEDAARDGSCVHGKLILFSLREQQRCCTRRANGHARTVKRRAPLYKN